MRAGLAVLMVVALGIRGARADQVPAKDQALLLLRILAYDHNLGNRVDNKTVTIVILSRGDDDAANDLAAKIRAIAKSTTLMNNAISVVRLAYSDKTFESDVSRTKAAALYIAGGLADSVGTITSTTQQHKMLSFTASQDLVPAGVSVGLTADDGHPQILVNLASSRQEGADLDVALLKAAKIVKK